MNSSYACLLKKLTSDSFSARNPLSITVECETWTGARLTQTQISQDLRIVLEYPLVVIHINDEIRGLPPVRPALRRRQEYWPYLGTVRLRVQLQGVYAAMLRGEWNCGGVSKTYQVPRCDMASIRLESVLLKESLRDLLGWKTEAE